MEQVINIKATIKAMRYKLEYLHNYSAGIRLQSILYGDHKEVLQVEDDVSEYLNYTKSVVQLNTKQCNYKDIVLEAMMRQQKHHERIRERDIAAYVLLQGIAQLKKKEQELLFDVYVRQIDKMCIMQKAGGIVESTYHRRIQKAILNLALIMHCEIYE